jgi:hypothetical protein
MHARPYSIFWASSNHSIDQIWKLCEFAIEESSHIIKDCSAITLLLASDFRTLLTTSLEMNENRPFCLISLMIQGSQFLRLILLGPSKRVWIRVRIAIRFLAQFAAIELRVLILYHTPITTVCKHISAKIDPKFDCIHLWHQIVCWIMRQFVREFVRVYIDGPLTEANT